MPFEPYLLTDILSQPAFSPHLFPSREDEELSILSFQETRFQVLAKSIIYQLASAITFLHHPDQAIAHRDIKPGNVLLSRDGRLKLVDFGISWKEGEDPALKQVDLWPEYAGKMYFDVATGPYRAPELLFGPSSYDAFATDLWSLGATLAEFFTPLRLLNDYDDDDDDINDESSADGTPLPFIVPANARFTDPSMRWYRDSLFNSERGQIGLAWSIFKTRGTPTDETWPTFKDLPDATKVTFMDAPPVRLSTLLPNLPPSTTRLLIEDGLPVHSPHSTLAPTPLDLVHRLLIYAQTSRLRATEVLRHPWFVAEPTLILPSGYPANSDFLACVGATWRNKNLGELLRTILPGRV